MLFFKLIWLCTGFGESWNFSFKQKHWVALAAGAATHQTTTEWWGSKHDPLLPHTWSDSLGNISLQTMLFKGFCSQILHWTLENADFSSCKWSRYHVFSSFEKETERVNPASLWPHHLSSAQRLPTLQEHAKHKHLCFSSWNAAAPVTLLIPAHKQLTEKAGFPQNTSGKRAEVVVIHSISQAKSSQGETWQ